ncbi:hydroxyacylglutathione hydrolase [Synechococcus sp. W4D4]|uniref:hydroxyacylglutathione hydrolase n=1 Tax=Synechococcus sp. W4D4 TaxID=3392294 RepID=UPI0039E90554
MHAATTVSLIPVLNDNYVFVLHGGGRGAAVVDPAVAEPVVAWLEERGLELEAILHTHHHNDHIGGAPGLLQRWPQAAVIASAADRERIPLQTQGVQGGDQFMLLGRRLRVIEVPGHTRHHIAYALEPEAEEAPELFCGDTLFAGGCGRLFEGTPEQMLSSLQSLSALGADTRVWCAHEYTEGNLRWAAEVEPENEAIRKRLAFVQQLRSEGRPTIPSSIGLEQATNLFMRAKNAAALRQLRGHKDLWRG